MTKSGRPNVDSSRPEEIWTAFVDGFVVEIIREIVSDLIENRVGRNGIDQPTGALQDPD